MKRQSFSKYCQQKTHTICWWVRLLISDCQWLFELQALDKDCQLEFEMLLQETTHRPHTMFLRQITNSQTVEWMLLEAFNDISCKPSHPHGWESQNCLRNQKFCFLGLIDRFNCYGIGFSKDDICICSHLQVGGLPDHSSLASQVRVLFPLLRM